MKFQTLNELLIDTCEKIAYIDQFRKSPCEDLLIEMYNAVKQEFENNLDLLLLTSDYKLEKKQLVYMLRKTKKYRKQSWKLTCEQIADDYHDNKFDMFNFGYSKVKDVANKYELFDKNNEKMKLSFMERLFNKKKEKFEHNLKVHNDTNSVIDGIDVETGEKL